LYSGEFLAEPYRRRKDAGQVEWTWLIRPRSAGEDAALKAFGAIPGVFGVVLGYPVFARRERKTSGEPAEADGTELAYGGPETKTRESLKQKVTVLGG